MRCSRADFWPSRYFLNFDSLMPFWISGVLLKVNSTVLGAVEPVLDVIAVDDDAGLVEFVERAELFVLWGEDFVERAGGVFVVDAGIVHDLVFGSEGEAVAFFLLHAIFDPGVAGGFGDAPFEGEFEVFVLSGGDDVVGAAIAAETMEATVFDAPAI